MKRIWPVLVVLLISVCYVAWRLVLFEGDPIAIAEIGSRYAELDLNGSDGYDGQFNVFIALDPNPTSVAPHLDVPAYRYQRILYPLLARLLAFGRSELIPWTMLLINILAHAGATYALMEILERRGIAAHYALIYGLWVGFISGIGLDLHEPLAYALVVLAFYLRDKNRYVAMATALGFALFAKETTAVFWLAILIADFIGREIDSRQLFMLLGAAMFGVWQVWLWRTFGMPGIGSGGDMATPFEWIPFMGFIRIGFVSMKALGLYALIFVPTIILPSLYALLQGLSGLKLDLSNEYAWSMFLNALVIVFLPFSTFREPLGLVRIFSGVVLSFLLFSAESSNNKQLNYAYFWTAMLVLLINQ